MNLSRLPAAVLLLACQPVAAAEPAPVIVTATRTAETADETLAPVTVITRADMERTQAQTLQDVLRHLPGVTVANNGGAGKSTSVFLRGTESDHVLVLVDGIEVGSATTGTAAFQHIPVEQIERIEIVRGPRSSLYGSEAIGGVIQIFTRRGGAGHRPWLSLGGGSYRTATAAAGIGGGDRRRWFSLAANGIDTGGFNACDGKPSPGGAGCFTIEPDRDGYRNLAASARAGLRLDNGLELEARVLRSEGTTAYDGSFVNESEAVQEVLGTTLRFAPAENWLVSVVGGRSRDLSDNFKDGTFKSRFDTVRDSLSWQNDFTVGTTHLVTAGIDYQDDRVAGTTAYTVTSRDNKGAFLQYQASLDRHDLQVALRRDDNEQFGRYTTGSLAWGLALDAGLRVTAGYGTAFKAPTFNELYFPGYGNAALQPEKSETIELGLRGHGTGARWTIDLFETRIDNLIAFDSAIFAPNNIARARIRGLEATVATRAAGWHLTAALTLLDPESRSGDANDGNLLPRRARESLRLDADRDLGNYTLGVTVTGAGTRYDDLANTRRLGGYATVDLRLDCALAPHWRLQGRIENLLDKDYETAAFYNQPGISLYLTLRYQP